MGSACCVAARDRTVTNGSTSEVLERNVRYSPSWSFRWDNRGRVAGEDASLNWSSDGISGNDRFDFKSRTTVETVYASEEGSPLDSFRSLAWQKSPTSERNGGSMAQPSSDPSTAVNSTEVIESTRLPAVSYRSPAKLPSSVPSVSSLSASPLSSQSQQLPVNLTPSRLPCHSPRHQLLRQVSDSRVLGIRSPTFSISEEASSVMLPGWSNESTRGSHCGSSDSWSIPAFPEFLQTSRRDRWSFDSESFGFLCDKVTRSSGRTSGSPSLDLRTCGICGKLLTEKSSWGGRKVIESNEIAVVSVLTCGHVFHAECLENMTLEINKYDPACPVCTFGEKQVLKMSEKGLKAEMNSKARKRYRNRVVDSDYNENLAMLEHNQKSSGHVGRCPKMSPSSSMKFSSGKPLLGRHFSFVSKGTRTLSESNSTRKRGFFWTRSSKERASSWKQ
nr:flocculation protein FLO11 [Ipomoea batatas]